MRVFVMMNNTNFKFAKKVLLLGIIFGFSSLFAGDLKAPFLFPSANVLPKGVRNISFKGVAITATEKFNNNGKSEKLSAPFNKSITVANILKGKTDPVERGAVEQALLSIGATGDDSFGTTTGQVNIDAMAYVPVIALGLTKKITIAVAIPIIKSSVNVDTGVIQANHSLHQKMTAALTKKGVSSKDLEFNKTMANPIGTKISDYGYNPLVDESSSKIGDVKLITKYQLRNNSKNKFTIGQEITLPTGKDQDINKVVDVASGDGQTDLGISATYEYTNIRFLTLILSTTYTFQLKDKNAERIPEVSDSKLTPDVDDSTERNLGDIWSNTIAAQYKINGIGFSVGYTYQTKKEDKYSGNKFNDERYLWLSTDTKQVMHSLQASIGYDTISLFKQKKFPVPLALSLNHTRVVSGINVVNDPLTSLDMAVFF